MSARIARARKRLRPVAARSLLCQAIVGAFCFVAWFSSLGFAFNELGVRAFFEKKV